MYDVCVCVCVFVCLQVGVKELVTEILTQALKDVCLPMDTLAQVNQIASTQHGCYHTAQLPTQPLRVHSPTHNIAAATQPNCNHTAQAQPHTHIACLGYVHVAFLSYQ